MHKYSKKIKKSEKKFRGSNKKGWDGRSRLVRKQMVQHCQGLRGFFLEAQCQGMAQMYGIKFIYFQRYENEKTLPGFFLTLTKTFSKDISCRKAK